MIAIAFYIVVLVILAIGCVKGSSDADDAHDKMMEDSDNDR